MAERLADLVAQIENVRQLDAVVAAMRGIAASRAQNGRSMLPGVEAYTEVVSRGIGEALTLLGGEPPAPAPHDGARRGLILFCAEQGFAGAFSQRVLDAAGALAPDTVVLLVGSRGSVVAEERGLKVDWASAMATHAAAVPSLADRLAEALYQRIEEDQLVRVDIIHPKSAAAGQVEVVSQSLLPLDFERFSPPNRNQPPLIDLQPATLLERLATEYVYAQLCEAAMHAFAAENEARVLEMAGAKTNIEAKLSTLTDRERQLRQSEITTEIIELAAGAEALQEGSA
ncbi:F0F1 ATP synthase subunit gamma [Phenylobacterium sp.]|uniref:F0F1 ATP synthase subunit gamma n=1 Tax=Phenylobacterium sp. TaxID=1871053 RepID=UPI0035B3F1FF